MILDTGAGIPNLPTDKSILDSQVPSASAWAYPPEIGSETLVEPPPEFCSQVILAAVSHMGSNRQAELL